jgi:hypothetical protein
VIPAPAPEARLLLACAAPGDGEIPAGLGTRIDPERFAALADRHRMVMLAARRLLGAGVLPAAAEHWLEGRAREGTARSMAMTAELAGLMRTLERAGIPAAAYKGPALGAQAYGDHGLRWCSDLDLLVEPERVPAAMAALEDAGYRRQRPLTPARERVVRRLDGEYPLRHPGTGTLVEVHCHVSPPRFAFRFDTRSLLARRVTVALGPFRVHALAGPDLLLALAVHGAKHRWRRMEWLASFAALRARIGVEPEALARAGAGIGAERCVRSALRLSAMLLGTPGVATDAETARLSAQAASHLLGDAPRWTPRDTAGNLRFNLGLCDTRADRLRTAWRWATLPTAEDWAWIDLPDAATPLYRVLRPFRLMGRAAGLARGE